MVIACQPWLNQPASETSCPMITTIGLDSPHTKNAHTLCAIFGLNAHSVFRLKCTQCKTMKENKESLRPQKNDLKMRGGVHF